MKSFLVCALALAGCGGNKVVGGEKPVLPPDKPAPDAAEAAGSGSAAPAAVGDPIKVMNALADEICACKDEACIEAVANKAGKMMANFADVTITPELEKELVVIQRKVATCVKTITQGPADPRLRAATKDDLAAYLKDVPGKGAKVFATITTSMGAFNCELFADKSPITVANFIGLATGKKPWRDPKSSSVVENKPFFDGLIFHRVIPGFMIQGGDPLGQGVGGPGYEFDDEVNNGLLVEPGVLAMANSGPATNGSQFFVMEGRASWLDNKHTVFGKCAEVDLVKKITGVEKECASCEEGDPRRDRPKTPVTIKSIAFSRKN